MDPRTSQRIVAIKKRNELDNIYDKAKSTGEKPRSRTVKYAPDGKGVKKTDKVSGDSAKNGRKRQAKALNDYLSKVKKAGENIPAEKKKKMQEKAQRNNAQKYRETINGYYQENVMTPAMYEAYQEQFYGKKQRK